MKSEYDVITVNNRAGSHVEREENFVVTKDGPQAVDAHETYTDGARRSDTHWADGKVVSSTHTFPEEDRQEVAKSKDVDGLNWVGYSPQTLVDAVTKGPGPLRVEYTLSSGEHAEAIKRLKTDDPNGPWVEQIGEEGKGQVFRYFKPVEVNVGGRVVKATDCQTFLQGYEHDYVLTKNSPDELPGFVKTVTEVHLTEKEGGRVVYGADRSPRYVEAPKREDRSNSAASPADLQKVLLDYPDLWKLQDSGSYKAFVAAAQKQARGATPVMQVTIQHIQDARGEHDVARVSCGDLGLMLTADGDEVAAMLADGDQVHVSALGEDGQMVEGLARMEGEPPEIELSEQQETLNKINRQGEIAQKGAHGLGKQVKPLHHLSEKLETHLRGLAVVGFGLNAFCAKSYFAAGETRDGIQALGELSENSGTLVEGTERLLKARRAAFGAEVAEHAPAALKVAGKASTALEVAADASKFGALASRLNLAGSLTEMGVGVYDFTHHRELKGTSLMTSGSGGLVLLAEASNPYGWAMLAVGTVGGAIADHNEHTVIADLQL